jgi:hypothetical protein
VGLTNRLPAHALALAATETRLRLDELAVEHSDRTSTKR